MEFKILYFLGIFFDGVFGFFSDSPLISLLVSFSPLCVHFSLVFFIVYLLSLSVFTKLTLLNKERNPK